MSDEIPAEVFLLQFEGFILDEDAKNRISDTLKSAVLSELARLGVKDRTEVRFVKRPGNGGPGDPIGYHMKLLP